LCSTLRENAKPPRKCHGKTVRNHHGGVAVALVDVAAVVAGAVGVEADTGKVEARADAGGAKAGADTVDLEVGVLVDEIGVDHVREGEGDKLTLQESRKALIKTYRKTYTQEKVLA